MAITWKRYQTIGILAFPLLYVLLLTFRRGDWEPELKERMRRDGFDRNYPIEVMLLRNDGMRDQLWQGHHRLDIAIELGFPTVPVRFIFRQDQCI